MFADCLLSRLARRGGVKRISSPIYEDLRAALSQYLREVESLGEGVFQVLVLMASLGFKRLRDLPRPLQQEDHYCYGCEHRTLLAKVVLLLTLDR